MRPRRRGVRRSPRHRENLTASWPRPFRSAWPGADGAMPRVRVPQSGGSSADEPLQTASEKRLVDAAHLLPWPPPRARAKRPAHRDTPVPAAPPQHAPGGRHAAALPQPGVPGRAEPDVGRGEGSDQPSSDDRLTDGGPITARPPRARAGRAPRPRQRAPGPRNTSPIARPQRGRRRFPRRSTPRVVSLLDVDQPVGDVREEGGLALLGGVVLGRAGRQLPDPAYWPFEPPLLRSPREPESTSYRPGRCSLSTAAEGAPSA
ncbi:hypothetical protein HDA39_003100 [Kribbella italica]|uniref:Uncharacterized protein n=1 Tax=Kribbella italica TaxID=1540520 RepID=A0A7W9J672_9ACTN|nr:hypothetical protein [Kribbella italica]